MARKGSPELSLPDWLSPPAPAATESSARAIQLSKRSCTSAVRIALQGAHRQGRQLSMAQLREATGFSTEEIGSCLSKLFRAKAIVYRPRTYGWNPEIDPNEND